jgi:hypothetical protein
MRIFRKLFPFVGIAAFAIAAFLVYHSTREYGLAGIIEAVRNIPGDRLLLSALCAAASYACLTGFDYLGVRYAGRRLAYGKAALASFVSLSIGHTLGLAPLGSGAVRARFYSRWGFDAEEIAKIILLSTVTVTIGQTALAGIVLLIEPKPVASWAHLGETAVRLVGVLCLALVALYVVLSAVLRQPLRIRGWSFAMPKPWIAFWQVAVGTANFFFLTATLHFVIVSTGPVPFWTTASIYVLANVAALISHVPGGLGVIEFVVLAFLPQASTVGALIAFRVIYFIAPLLIGGGALAATELFDRRRAARKPVAGSVEAPVAAASRPTLDHA